MAAFATAAPGVNPVLPVSDGRPRKQARPVPLDTGNQAVIDTGKSEVADTGNLLDDAAILANLAQRDIGNERFNSSEWRIEVYTNRNGRRYWNHRRRGKRGGKENWKFGGKFDELSTERQEQYWQRAKGKS